ncbi:GNAT family N-acetyltransferase [Caulobacter sp. 17J65-9]|nr:GNAT family N-acetyltransferase [Caulobacter sp. 17J65-9]
MTVRLTVPDAPSPEDRAAVLAPLAAFNRRNGPPTEILPLAVLLTDEAGSTVGGLWGKTGYDWLFVELLAVPERLRGQDLGAALLAEAERLARARGCVGAWLDTYAFQARGFYEKQGYTAFGTLEGHPVGGARHFMSKRF